MEVLEDKLMFWKVVEVVILMIFIKISAVCKILRSDSRLAGGYNALGFSQGGLLFRGLIQRCPSPPARSVRHSHWSGSDKILCSDWLISEHGLVTRGSRSGAFTCLQMLWHPI